ncbi:unnamed protein product [Dibothriocephalus latus]|uniref:Uncharacterized protein n=1 Tax=Dibothriocephalus latus TaxID=60516 RepID=A0A3P6RHC3_DIBLA|nr:unnamed protein product [Dibothriocephalus latus]
MYIKNYFFALQMSKRRVTSLTVEEILTTLEEFIEDADVERADAVIIPPESDTLSDNEDIDDDCTGNVDVDDVAGALELHVAAQIINDDVNDIETGETPEVRAETRQAPKKRKLSNSVPTWRSKAP